MTKRIRPAYFWIDLEEILEIFGLDVHLTYNKKEYRYEATCEDLIAYGSSLEEAMNNLASIWMKSQENCI